MVSGWQTTKTPMSETNHSRMHLSFTTLGICPWHGRVCNEKALCMWWRFDHSRGWPTRPTLRTHFNLQILHSPFENSRWLVVLVTRHKVDSGNDKKRVWVDDAAVTTHRVSRVNWGLSKRTQRREGGVISISTQWRYRQGEEELDWGLEVSGFKYSVHFAVMSWWMRT